MMLKREYFDSKKYEVLESKKMILIFKKTLWLNCLRFSGGFNKEYYRWVHDIEGKMHILIEKKVDEK